MLIVDLDEGSPVRAGIDPIPPRAGAAGWWFPRTRGDRRFSSNNEIRQAANSKALYAMDEWELRFARIADAIEHEREGW